MNKNYFNKMMKAQAKVDKAASKNETAATKDNKTTEAPVFNAKVTNLMFYKQYDTYQGLMSVWSEKITDIDKVFNKVVLYVIQWLKDRIGAEQLETIEEVKFLNEVYPEPENYEKFSIDTAKNIMIESALDIRSLYWQEENSWCFRIVEPDNNNDNKDVVGRIFITNITVKKEDDIVALVVRVTCKEPTINPEDASVYRPAFIRKIFLDEELSIGELGIPKKYAFTNSPICVNGKAGTECDDLYEGLINNDRRQMPIVFVDDNYYQANKFGVDRKTEGFLGFSHVVVLEKSYNRLFATNMNNEEYVGAMDEKQIICHEDCNLLKLGCGPKYFDQEDPKTLENLASIVKKSTMRKNFDFGEYEFYSNMYPRYEKNVLHETAISNEIKENIEELKNKVSKLQVIISEKNRDAKELQGRITELERDVQQKDSEIKNCYNDFLKEKKVNEKLCDKLEKLEELNNRNKGNNLLADVYSNVNSQNDNKKNMPLINLLFVDMSSKDSILEWIDENYADTIIIHPKAKKSFTDDPRHIDMKKFCLMIHYLSGYTIHRNEGGRTIDSNAARDYDPCGKALKVDPVSTGQGSTEMYKDAYSIDISRFSETERKVTLDLHIGQGKGSDANMLRIYFYYSQEMKKSIVGYMPDHLPTRSQGR